MTLLTASLKTIYSTKANNKAWAQKWFNAVVVSSGLSSESYELTASAGKTKFDSLLEAYETKNKEKGSSLNASNKESVIAALELLATTLVEARKLNILRDSESIRIMQRLFLMVADEDNMEDFMEFIDELDTLLSKYAKSKDEKLDKSELEQFGKDLDTMEENHKKGKGGKKGKKAKAEAAPAKEEPEEEEDSEDNEEEEAPSKSAKEAVEDLAKEDKIDLPLEYQMSSVKPYARLELAMKKACNYSSKPAATPSEIMVIKDNSLGGEYQVPGPSGTDRDAYYTDDKQDAIDTARSMYKNKNLVVKFKTGTHIDYDARAKKAKSVARKKTAKSKKVTKGKPLNIKMPVTSSAENVFTDLLTAKASPSVKGYLAKAMRKHAA